MSGTRTITARLGLLAVLFQAILFGWHHHDLTFPGRLSMPVVENPAAPPQIADDEDGCEICQVLHHLTAAPIEFAVATPPRAINTRLRRGQLASLHGATAAAFHARGPPSSAAAIG
jgi:hypothetical protein